MKIIITFKKKTVIGLATLFLVFAFPRKADAPDCCPNVIFDVPQNELKILPMTDKRTKRKAKKPRP